MPVQNQDVADIFNRIADLLDIQGENEFRIRAYRRAAETISGLSENVRSMAADGKKKSLSDIPGIGEDLAGKIREIVETGSLAQLEDLEEQVPPGLARMMRLEDLGPRRVGKIYDELGIHSLKELKKAAGDGRIQDLEGLGEKTESHILEEIERLQGGEGYERTRLDLALRISGPLLDHLRSHKGVKRAEAAGSIRRKKETVGDLDVLVTCRKGQKDPVMDHFTDYEDVEKVISKGTTKSTVRLKQGFQVDLRAVPAVGFGAALLYFTGSKDHNIELRKRARSKNWKINEYGLFKNGDRLAGKTEESMYKKLKMSWVPPELRENRGELKAAENNGLPDLLKREDIRGDLHSHTTDTDGKADLEQMVQAARDLGYEYLAVTDHTRRVSVAGGMDAGRLRKQLERIHRFNDSIRGFRVLKSAEVDILKDGSLDLPDDVLDELDIVLCSIHYHRTLPRQDQTKRLLSAMDHPRFQIFAHPTGRLIGEREAYEINMEKVMEKAKDKGVFFEINADPRRLDLNDRYTKMARDNGILVSLGTDAHSIDALSHMQYGVWQARRGWLTADDVINTRSWNDLKALLR